MQGEDADVLKAHTNAVGTKAAGYIWYKRIASGYIDLIEYNSLLQRLAHNESLVDHKTSELGQVEADLAALVKAGGSPEDQHEFERVIRLMNKELQILKRLDASANDARLALGKTFPEVIKAATIKKTGPRDAFKNATRKLEMKSEAELVNYLIRAVSDEGAVQERHIIKEVKDTAGKVLDYSPVARLLYEETKDSTGHVSHRITPIILHHEEFVLHACQQIESVFQREIQGARSSRFSTALDHLTNALQSIPLASRGFVYYCAISKASMVSVIRELVHWVDFRFREKNGEGCQFLALPLMGGEEVETEVVEAANAHLQMRVAEIIAAIQALRRERAAIPHDEDEKVRESKENVLQAKEKVLRQEVTDIQANVKVCLEGLSEATGVLQQGSKVLLKEYAALLGL